ncbi:CPBP family intramembrane metalloprotease [Salinibacterium sp. SYSU T00001]|uniref:CPBP family intramembrane glutamic endopeptidase n=1 Tax=Homoserinimonas sedimenticola TaxID=2986805 RepID=UPI00223546F0|nr:CPBP family intramembrane glutamic endopeptidase [Salinibacterium sedimenticola]MCW4385694.1 CPBP family intramembrane metalloprotease [Salinibacterium sedimenticola]
MTQVDKRGVALFITIAFIGAWLVASPLWFSAEGLAAPYSPLVLIAMMFVPTVAAAIAAKVFPAEEGFLRETTLRPRRRFRRWWGYLLIAWFGPLLLVVAAVAVAAALGWIRLDLVNFSGFELALEATLGQAAQGLPIQAIVIAQLVSLVFIPFVNAIPALGEEIGWRGFLQARLLPLGQWPAVLITGVVWGLWHAPVILLGYNYPEQNPFLALLLMVVFTTLVSVLLGWLTIASGTVWTAEVAHGFINGAAGLPALLLAAGSPFDNLTGSLLGYPGWIVFALAIGVLVGLRRFPVRPRATLSE